MRVRVNMYLYPYPASREAGATDLTMVGNVRKSLPRTHTYRLFARISLGSVSGGGGLPLADPALGVRVKGGQDRVRGGTATEGAVRR